MTSANDPRRAQLRRLKAAAVGALADWFAVVALFRRPMGLPIPHTAIIPRSKERIGDSLALFVRDQFLEPGVLLAKLQVFDPASRLGSWLADPARSRMLADMARGWALQALDFFDEPPCAGSCTASLCSSCGSGMPLPLPVNCWPC